MATHSSVLAWRIPGTWGAWWAAVYGVTPSRTRLKQLSSIYIYKERERKREIGEGSGDPLQYSCLENPMDRGAWRATVHGAAKSQTQLSD